MGKPGTKPVTPAQAAKAWEVYSQTGNKSEAARMCGLSESAVRGIIKKKVADQATRRDLHASAMEQAEIDGRLLADKVRRQLSTALDAKAIPVRDLTALASAVHDNLRVISSVRVNQAKLSGAFIEKTQVNLTATVSPLTIIAPPEVEPE